MNQWQFLLVFAVSAPGLVFGVLELVPGVMQQLQDAKSGAGAP